MTKDMISGIKDINVIAIAEGADCGAVSQLYIDPERKRLAALACKHGRRGDERLVRLEDVHRIGRDVVLVDSEHSVLDNLEAPGTRFDELRGRPVATSGGAVLGEVADLEIADGDGAISEIYLADGRKLPVDPAEFTIGPDQVVVPETYATRIVDTGEQEEGFWARLGQNMRSALAFHGGVLPADVFDDEPETDSRSAGGHA